MLRNPFGFSGLAGALLLMYSAPGAPAELTHQELKAIVTKALDKKAVPIWKPKFRIKKRYFRFCWHYPQRYGTTKVGDSFKLLELPLNLQLLVETHRRYPPAVPIHADWKRTLAKLERIVKTELELINSERGNQEELRKKLFDLDYEAKKLYGEAGVREGRRRRLVTDRFSRLVVDSYGTKGPRKYLINLLTEPPECQVCYLNLADYESLKEQGGLDQVENWYLMENQGFLPHGIYFFRAYFKGGKVATKKAFVNKNQTLKLQSDE
jgi:hypothetical protein